MVVFGGQDLFSGSRRIRRVGCGSAADEEDAGDARCEVGGRVYFLAVTDQFKFQMAGRSRGMSRLADR